MANRQQKRPTQKRIIRSTRELLLMTRERENPTTRPFEDIYPVHDLTSLYRYMRNIGKVIYRRPQRGKA